MHIQQRAGPTTAVRHSRGRDQREAMDRVATVTEKETEYCVSYLCKFVLRNLTRFITFIIPCCLWSFSGSLLLLLLLCRSTSAGLLILLCKRLHFTCGNVLISKSETDDPGIVFAKSGLTLFVITPTIVIISPVCLIR